MHLLVPVFFNAPFGGLHENVRASVLYMLARKHRTTVVCRPGPFAEHLREHGARVIETDYAEISYAAAMDEIRALHQRDPIDLIHAHPFAARRLGVIAARVLGLPCVVTMHGKYLDALPQTIEDLEAVFTVSEGIRHYLLTECGLVAPEKLHVVPNTPNAKLFKAVRVAPPAEAEGRVVISLITRLDQDKAFILEVFYQAVTYAVERYPGRIHWQVVGQGSLLEEFAERVEALRGENSVSYTGWLQGEALRDAYCQSDAVIAPGRCTLEAMSCGVPAIALGSKGYNGLVDDGTWQQAVFSNFGGVGDKHEGYVDGAVERDLDRLMRSRTERRRLGGFGRLVVRQSFNADEMHRRLLGFYQLVVAAYRATSRAKLDESDYLELRLRELTLEYLGPRSLRLNWICKHAEGLHYAWYLLRDGEVIEKHPYTPSPQHTQMLSGPGRYQVRCFVRDEAGRKISVMSQFVEVGLDQYGPSV